MASHVAAEPVLVKVRSRQLEKAAYIECAAHIDGNQLRLAKRGGPADVIVLSSLELSAINRTYKRNRFYIAVETGSKLVKLKLSSAEAQERWFEAFRKAVAANDELRQKSLSSSPSAPGPALALVQPDIHQSEAIPAPSPASPDFVERMAASFHNSSMASDSSATHSSFSSFYPSTPPLVPPRPDYTYAKTRQSKVQRSRHSSVAGTSASSSASMLHPLDPQARSPAAIGHAFSPDEERFSVIESVDGLPVIETVFFPEGRITSL